MGQRNFWKDCNPEDSSRTVQNRPIFVYRDGDSRGWRADVDSTSTELVVRGSVASDGNGLTSSVTSSRGVAAGGSGSFMRLAEGVIASRSADGMGTSSLSDTGGPTGSPHAVGLRNNDRATNSPRQQPQPA